MTDPKVSAGNATRGFTVIEALIAFVILLIGMLAMLAIIPSSYSNTVRDSERVQAIAAGQQYLDQLTDYVAYNGTTNLPAPPTVAIDSGDVFEGTGTAASSGGVFTIVGNCPAKSGSNAEFDCTVTVTWTESGSPRTVSVESYVTSQQ